MKLAIATPAAEEKDATASDGAIAAEIEKDEADQVGDDEEEEDDEDEEKSSKEPAAKKRKTSTTKSKATKTGKAVKKSKAEDGQSHRHRWRVEAV